jgi:hypothetical protein
MAGTTIPISDTTLARLGELARWSGTSVTEALERAIREQYHRRFWEAVNAGYAALRADRAAWAEVEAERKEWDATLLDGLDTDERWSDNGVVLPPPGQGTAS